MASVRRGFLGAIRVGLRYGWADDGTRNKVDNSGYAVKDGNPGK